MLGQIKKHWRVVLLVVVVVASTVVLFAPQFAPEEPAAPGSEGANAATGVTNLQYGLDLAGGTRVRAPLLGHTASDVAFENKSTAQVASDVAAELPNTTSTDVKARVRDPANGGTGQVEVTDAAVNESEFETALIEAGYEPGEIRQGVTEETRQAAVQVIEGKINEAGLSGGSARVVTNTEGRHFVLVEVPGEGRQDVINLLEERGTVRIDIYYDQNGNYSTEQAVLSQGDFASVGTASRDRNDVAYVPVTVVDDAPEGQQSPAEQFESAAVEYGVAQSGGSTCTYMQEPVGETQDPCLLLVVNGEVVNAFGMQANLARSMQNQEWSTDPQFRLTTGRGGDSYERAQQISIDLRAGALPAQLGISEGSVSYISATQGESFRSYSLIAGVLSVLAVAGMVFLRYREPEVALPMIVTALAEVYALLGFAALVGYPISLPVIAGFIAVVGTGVDDLVIIADEVMSEGDVRSQTVFDSRFRRAFWVIGAAAATTIIAMSPLMVLSLGDLSGFAIFTIMGVLLGVLVSRPAYGDILRTLLTER
ncbi:preprotein translocase subunit SecD [Haloparvum sp. PAK95]|uniref:preprotein translocase subunit SecD n=1 Tax=Haloparvum sp. PAK95 TaxID=3418962 RepID=UPI003D2EBC46